VVWLVSHLKATWPPNANLTQPPQWCVPRGRRGGSQRRPGQLASLHAVTPEGQERSRMRCMELAEALVTEDITPFVAQTRAQIVEQHYRLPGRLCALPAARPAARSKCTNSQEMSSIRHPHLGFVRAVSVDRAIEIDKQTADSRSHEGRREGTGECLPDDVRRREAGLRRDARYRETRRRVPGREQHPLSMPRSSQVGRSSASRYGCSGPMPKAISSKQGDHIRIGNRSPASATRLKLVAD
jgi:hypothetical protein